MSLSEALQKRGAYLLILRIPTPVEVHIGALGTWALEAGFYLYVGSAMGGFERRVLHYLRPRRKRRWHIDHLLEVAELLGVVLLPSEARIEEAVAERLAQSPYFTSVIPGFGASDSTAPTHLFRFTGPPSKGDAVAHPPTEKRG